MSYPFNNLPFKWTKADGAQPTAEEIALGLQGGMALPANFVNQQWTATYEAIAELQDAIDVGSIFLTPDVVIAMEQLISQDSFAVGAGHSMGSGSLILTGKCAAIGQGNKVNALNLSVGKFCKTPTAATTSGSTGDLFIVGNGLGDDTTGAASMRSNAFRVTAAGEVMGTQAYAASGADFAECFEWADGNPDNEDRRGLFVTLDGEKIRLAEAEDDYILGAVSATPTVIGDAHTDDWQGKYERDVFGARVLENGAWKLAEGFDSEQDTNYTSRLKRAEWAAVGLVGKIIVVDDGSCKVNGYCRPLSDGIATSAEHGYRVMARIDESHVKILLK